MVFFVFCVIIISNNHAGFRIKGNKPFIKILSGTPQDALLLPVNLREKTVALLYVDNGNNSVLNADVNYLLKLASMAALAFEILILKKRNP